MRLAPHIFLRAVAVATLCVLLPVAGVEGQNTFRACRIPNVGAIYMIAVAGAPAACLSANHVEFSWTEGGAPADGSVTTAKLANGAVTPAKLAVLHGDLGGRDADDHSQYLLASGSRQSSRGFDVTGTLGSGGAIPAEGSGARFMWWTDRAALRAGEVTAGNEAVWSGTNIGRWSFGFGRDAIASGDYSTAIGWAARASAMGAFAQGDGSIASGVSALAMGGGVTATGAQSIALGTFSQATGARAMALMGGSASGDQSIAIGLANTNGQPGSFVFGDVSNLGSIQALQSNEFVVRAAGGYRLYTHRNGTSGVTLASGAGSWASVSDRAAKHRFQHEDGETALARIANMPIQSWSYLSQDSTIRHLGPVAQDFHHAFGLGESDKTITTSDIDGVNMLAIQALEKRTAELRAEVRALQKQIEKMRHLPPRPLTSSGHEQP